jgi:hypothetical protein
VGQEDDVEGHAPACQTESDSLPKGDNTEPAGDAGGGGPPKAPSGIALLGYFNPTSFSIVSQDILLKKSP